jgi:signal transduction histidine kinase
VAGGKQMKSIKKRLVSNFLFIIIITVVILEVLIINIVGENYYKNLEDNMYNQIRVSSDLYLRYFSDSSLKDNVLNNVDTFWKQTTAQVQIVDTKGNVLMDSIGVTPGNLSQMEDIEKALKGERGRWIGNVDYDNERVMTIAYPLKSGNNIVGALRFISSLREVNKEIKYIAIVFIGIGLVVILISGVMSIFLSNTIAEPLKEVTLVAEEMAAGNYKIQSKKRYDDEVGKLSDTLNYMAEEIQKEDQLKNEFISSMSHELRTPLTSIKGWAITLKNKDVSSTDMLFDGLDIIEKESDRLTSMVEELLDFSKFTSGKTTLKQERVNIIDVILQIKTQLTPRAVREGIDFRVELNEDVPFIISDENRLKQVFINVLDNSFKFTPMGGSIILTLDLLENSIVIKITDTGCGIPAEELPRVKEKFFKGKSSKSQNGIGLSICDEIIKLMNGPFEIYSEVDKGTEVVITLPL